MMKEFLPAIIEEQLKKVILPLIIERMRSLTQTVEEDVMPKLESHIKQIFQELVQN